jgi:hypothetical protein
MKCKKVLGEAIFKVYLEEPGQGGQPNQEKIVPLLRNLRKQENCETREYEFKG